MAEVVEIHECTAVKDTGQALLIEFDDGDAAWIPHSQIHDDSEVYQEGDTGTLVVTKWIAQKRDLIERGTLRLV